MPPGQLQDLIQVHIPQEEQAPQEQQNPGSNTAVPYSELPDAESEQILTPEILSSLEALRYITDFPPRDESNIDPSLRSVEPLQYTQPLQQQGQALPQPLPSQLAPNHLATSQNTTQIKPVQAQQQTHGFQGDGIPQTSQALRDSIPISRAQVQQQRQRPQYGEAHRRKEGSELQRITWAAQDFALACRQTCEEVDILRSQRTEGHQQALDTQNRRVLRAYEVYHATLARLHLELGAVKGKPPNPALLRPPVQPVQSFQNPSVEQVQSFQNPSVEQVQSFQNPPAPKAQPVQTPPATKGQTLQKPRVQPAQPAPATKAQPTQKPQVQKAQPAQDAPATKAQPTQKAQPQKAQSAQNPLATKDQPIQKPQVQQAPPSQHPQSQETHAPQQDPAAGLPQEKQQDRPPRFGQFLTNVSDEDRQLLADLYEQTVQRIRDSMEKETQQVSQEQSDEPASMP
ncbi:hypothetical protein B0J18DRAFT_430761 [Chaetomium sp. MPI-SDFR-AT-0129]|nr:hypothetical protein B0J18DRAFT_430761 [Chaetomium sp. MPI-SDFR-AT-0129]